MWLLGWTSLLLLLVVVHVDTTLAFGVVPQRAATSTSRSSWQRSSYLCLSSSSSSLSSSWSRTRPALSLSAASAPPLQYPSGSSRTLDSVAEWHRQRRNEMVALPGAGARLVELENQSANPVPILLLLLLCNLSLGWGAVSSQHWSLPRVVLTAFGWGSLMSLWQLQILHDVLHGSLFHNSANNHNNNPVVDWLSKQKNGLLFWGSLPSVFGYYLYLRFGHLTHHKNVGRSTSSPSKDNDATTTSYCDLQLTFASNQTNFEDGDLLFVAHRMKLKGKPGPTLALWWQRGRDQKTKSNNNNDNYKSILDLPISISHWGFSCWKENRAIHNAMVFGASFLSERILLVVNDVVVALTGQNYFFPNKPPKFHRVCARYARVATLLRLSLLTLCGWKSLLYLYLSETLWSVPPHPASAMFVTNHGSTTAGGESTSSPACIPTRSTYAGRWYSLLTLGTNYHCEHHDFPRIPLHRLGQIRSLVPSHYYRRGSSDNLGKILLKAFGQPDHYACLDVGLLNAQQQQT